MNTFKKVFSNTTIFIASVLFLTILPSFIVNEKKYQEAIATAHVKKIQGLYIFFASTPDVHTEYLGTVKVNVTWDSQTTTRLNAMIKSCKKDFPTAEALIFNEIDFGSADAIKFK